MNSPNTSDDPLRRFQPVADTREAANCDKHGPYERNVLQMFPDSKPIKGGCPACAQEKAADDAIAVEAAKVEREAQRKRRAIEQAFNRSGIPERFRDRTFDSYRADTKQQQRALQIARAFASGNESGGSLVFCGKPGTGKTHLACAIGHALIDDEAAVLFLTALAAARHVKDTYRKDSEKSETQAIGELLEPGLLILDEVGVQLGSETEMRILFEVINERYADCRPTVLISNLNEQELTKLLGERIMDRFREGGAVVAFDWESYRGKRAA